MTTSVAIKQLYVRVLTPGYKSLIIKMDDSAKGDDSDDFFDIPSRSAYDLDKEDSKKYQVNENVTKKFDNQRFQAPIQHEQDGREKVSSESESISQHSSESEVESDVSSKGKRVKSRSRSTSLSSRNSSRSKKSISLQDTTESDSDSRTRISSDRDRSRSASASSPSSSSSSSSRRQRENKRRNSSSSLSSSSCSEEEQKKKSIRPSNVRRQAWSAVSGSKPNNPIDRPKTAKTNKQRSLNLSGSIGRRKNRHTHSIPDSDTDSDITDVSPIPSPRNGSVNNGYKPTSSKFQALPLEDKDYERDVLDGGDNRALDLNILMKAVSELEKQKRVKANMRRVMFAPTRAQPMEKSNYSFSNDDTVRIEKENKRLLSEIVRQMHGTEKVRQPQLIADAKVKQSLSTLTASAVNRRRDHRRIESENLAFLRRLQKVKPSRGISREEQLNSYKSTLLHGVPIAALHPEPCSGKRSRLSSHSGSISGRSYSMNSLRGTASECSISTAVSCQSSHAGSRPSSGKLSERPPWNSKW